MCKCASDVTFRKQIQYSVCVCVFICVCCVYWCAVFLTCVVILCTAQTLNATHTLISPSLKSQPTTLHSRRRAKSTRLKNETAPLCRVKLITCALQPSPLKVLRNKRSLVSHGESISFPPFKFNNKAYYPSVPVVRGTWDERALATAAQRILPRRHFCHHSRTGSAAHYGDRNYQACMQICWNIGHSFE